MARVIVALALLVGAVDAQLSIDAVNPKVIQAEYAVRGKILERAGEIERDMKENPDNWPFQEIVRCNIGNPQALGQAPPAFARAVLSQVVLPKSKGSRQVRERADAYRNALSGGVGAYSDSQGVSLVREEVAAFISERDGHAASPDDIFLTDGASAGVRHLTQLLVSGPKDGVLAPAPQYPLYSATTTLYDGTLGSYYLDEAADWAAPVAELKKSYADVVAKGAVPKMVVIINPGNPTGASLPLASLEAIVRFVESHPGLVLGADEVYQENVYGDAPPFVSFKKVVKDLGSKIPLVSFHSISKGFTGECGLRGGYFELTNIPKDVKAQLTKLASVSLCSNTMGQVAVGLMVNPPTSGSELKAYEKEKTEKLASLVRRANKMAESLNALEGVSCVKPQGAMYLFPSITLPAQAVAAAARLSMAPDAFYSLKLLEGTGLVTVPGSGFGQRNGTWHFRTTFLPAEKQIDQVVEKLGGFHSAFLAKYGYAGGDL
jgi:alanine transaminase